MSQASTLGLLKSSLKGLLFGSVGVRGYQHSARKHSRPQFELNFQKWLRRFCETFVTHKSTTLPHFCVTLIARWGCFGLTKISIKLRCPKAIAADKRHGRKMRPAHSRLTAVIRNQSPQAHTRCHGRRSPTRRATTFDASAIAIAGQRGAHTLFSFIQRS